MPAGERPEGAGVLEAGALLVLYSGGLVESGTESPDDGLARMRDVITPLRDRPVEEICDLILAGLGVDSTRDDDVVVLCVRLGAIGARPA